MKLIHIAWAAALLTMSTTASAAPLTFRGLSASSTKSDVLKAFPKAVPRSTCRAGETTARSASGVTDCVHVIVDGYKLDNDLFSLSFIFNPNGSLRYVSVMKMYGGFRDTGLVPLTTIRSAAQSMSDLLASKYGPAVLDAPGSFGRLKSSVLALEWQPDRGTTWQSGGDRVSLQADAYEGKTTLGLFYGSVQVFYTFARRADLDRL